MRKFVIYYAAFALALASCASNPSAGAYSDGALIEGQRAEIERLKRDITDMGANQREVSERIDGIARGLANSLERCATIEDLFAEIDRFVRELIDENNKLGNLQQPNRETDAGSR